MSDKTVSDQVYQNALISQDPKHILRVMKMLMQTEGDTERYSTLCTRRFYVLRLPNHIAEIIEKVGETSVSITNE